MSGNVQRPFRRLAIVVRELRILADALTDRAFAIPLQLDSSVETQAAPFRDLMQATDEARLCYTTRTHSADVVCVLPLPCQPADVAATPADLAQLKAAGDLHAWATIAAIVDTPTYVHAALALLRMQALREPAPSAGVRIGKWQSARPPAMPMLFV